MENINNYTTALPYLKGWAQRKRISVKRVSPLSIATHINADAEYINQHTRFSLPIPNGKDKKYDIVIQALPPGTEMNIAMPFAPQYHNNPAIEAERTIDPSLNLAPQTGRSILTSLKLENKTCSVVNSGFFNLDCRRSKQYSANTPVGDIALVDHPPIHYIAPPDGYESYYQKIRCANGHVSSGPLLATGKRPENLDYSDSKLRIKDRNSDGTSAGKVAPGSLVIMEDPNPRSVISVPIQGEKNSTRIFTVKATSRGQGSNGLSGSHLEDVGVQLNTMDYNDTQVDISKTYNLDSGASVIQLALNDGEKVFQHSQNEEGRPNPVYLVFTPKKEGQVLNNVDIFERG
jgi:hypothetical protein